MNPVSPIRPPQPADIQGLASAARPAVRPAPGSPAGAASFQSLMAQSVDKVNSLQYSAQSTALRFLQGEPVEVHQVALEQQQAAMAFDLLLEVRNKVVSAYQEVMRMPL